MPQHCLLCASRHGGALGLCAACQLALPWHDQPRCPQCALATGRGEHCGHCLAAPPDFDLTIAALRYEYPLAGLLQNYKYAQALSLASTLAQLLRQRLPEARPELLIPMPLHPTRLRERGFNQALEIARILARHDIALDGHSCVRIKQSPPQASLPLKQRVRNMRGAFRCQRDLHGRRVALLDDVMTTGASLNALAQAVKRAGASHVECWVVARTLPR